MRLEEHPCWHLVETKNGVAHRLGVPNSPVYFMSPECPPADRAAYEAAPGGKKNHRLELKPGWEIITEVIYIDGISEELFKSLQKKYQKMVISMREYDAEGVHGINITTYRHESGKRYPEYGGRDVEKELERLGVEVYNALLDNPPQATPVKCHRCGGEWYPRVARPSVCPRCHSTRWDTPRTGREPGRKPKR